MWALGWREGAGLFYTHRTVCRHEWRPTAEWDAQGAPLAEALFLPPKRGNCRVEKEGNHLPQLSMGLERRILLRVP